MSAFLTKALENLENQDDLNYWFYELGKPFYSGKILEIGSGIGRLSEFFIKENLDIALSEYDEDYYQELKRKFPSHSNNIFIIDLLSEDIINKYAEHLGVYDTIFSSDVIEHIENHDLAIENCTKLLKTGGKLITIVPANEILFSDFDRKIGHFRRYSMSSLTSLLEAHDLKPVYSQYFNALAGVGSFVLRKLLRKSEFSQNTLSNFNKLVPIAKYLDQLTCNKFGNHLFSVAVKQ